MSNRILKINSLVQHQISEIIKKDLNLKIGVFLTVAKVDTSKDLRYTRIFISVYPEKESHYVFETLKKELHSLQNSLNKRLQTKLKPEIKFILDQTETQAQEVEDILKNLP